MFPANTNPLGFAAKVVCFAIVDVVVLANPEVPAVAPRAAPAGPACVIGTLPVGL